MNMHDINGLSASLELIADGLKVIRPAGAIQLVAICPQQTRPIDCRSFVMPEDIDEAASWAYETNKTTRNVYFTVNMTSQHSKKSSKGDIIQAIAYWADCDPQIFKFKSYEKARDHLIYQLLPELKNVASYVIDSGNGLSPFFVMDYPEILDGEFEEYEAINEKVGKAFDGPGTFNCDRVMRLPGTLNYPNDAKLKKGYPSAPSLATLIHSSNRKYSKQSILELVNRILLKKKFHLYLESHPKVLARYRGSTEGMSDTSGSAMDFSMVSMLKLGGFELDEIRFLLDDWRYGSVSDQRGDDRYWQRCWNRTAQDQLPTIDISRLLESKSSDQKQVLFDSVGDHIDEIKPINWIVDGYSEADALCVLFGPSGVGKSFVTVSMACCIATGFPWFGMEVNQGPVFYVAGEGHHGLIKRFKAWSIQNKVPIDKNTPLYKSRKSIQILDINAVIALRDEIQALCDAGSAPKMVIIDTLARNFGDGDENTAKDMGRFVHHVDEHIRSRFGCNVTIVHHSGHDQERARGSSSLRAAVDQEFCITGQMGQLTFKVTKMKDAETPAQKNFRIQQVIVGQHDDDVEIVSATIVPDGNPLNIDVGTRKNGTKVTALDVIAEMHRIGWRGYEVMAESLGMTKISMRRTVETCITAKLIEKDGRTFSISQEAMNHYSMTGALLIKNDEKLPKK